MRGVYPRHRRLCVRASIRRDSRRGARADQAAHSRCPGLRAPWRAPGVVPDPARHARKDRQGCLVQRVGDFAAPLGAARSARERHADTGLRARRRASRRRAACRCGGAPSAARDRRAAPKSRRRGVSRCGRSGLRDRAARRALHGARAHRPGLAFGRDRGRVRRGSRRGTRLATPGISRRRIAKLRAESRAKAFALSSGRPLSIKAASMPSREGRVSFVTLP